LRRSNPLVQIAEIASCARLRRARNDKTKMDFSLTPSQQEIQARAHEFAQTRVAPFAREWDERGEMPRSVIDEIAATGFLGGPLPQEYGGCDWDNVSLALCYEELGRTDSSVRGLMTVHTSLVSQCILQWGSDAQKRDVLGVKQDLLTKHTAVSEPVAAAMAEGAVARAGANYAVSTTGYAGPDGGTPHDPVGTVYIGIAGPSGTRVVRVRHGGDRSRIRILATQGALDLLRRTLLK